MSAQSPPKAYGADRDGDPGVQLWSPPRLVRLELPDTEATATGDNSDIVWS